MMRLAMKSQEIRSRNQSWDFRKVIYITAGACRHAKDWQLASHE